MHRSNPLKTTALYTLGAIFNKAIAFICIPIFSRMLSQSEYGVLSSFDSYVSVFTVIIGLTVYETVRNAYVDYHESVDSYVSSIMTLVCSTYLIVLIILSGLNCFAHVSSWIMVFLCASKSFAAAITNIVSSYYMMNENIYKRTALLVIPNLLGTVIGIAAVYYLNDNRYYGRIVPIVVIMFALSVYYLARFGEKGKRFADKSIWKYALSLSLPLIPHGLSVTLLASSDRIIIGHMSSMANAGIYGLTYNFGMVAFALITAFESVWIPRFTKNMMAGQKAKIHKEVVVYTSFTAVVIFAILICAKEVFLWFADEKYWDGVAILPPVIAASFLIHLFSVFVGAEMYYKKNIYIAVASASAAILNIVLNLICIKVWGYKAAAYTTVISYFALFVAHYLLTSKIDSELYPIKLFIPSILIVSVGWALSLLLADWYIARWAIGLAIVIVCFAVVALNFKRIKSD